MNDKLTKPESPPTLVGGKLKAQGSSFQKRLNANKANAPEPDKMPHRICLMLDCSGSMSGEPIEMLTQAVQNFAQRSSFADTAVAIETFPETLQLELCSVQSRVIAASYGLKAGGGTPMKACVERSIENIPMTRGVLISDGAPTDWSYIRDDNDDIPSESPLAPYVTQKIPIDCVHIGSSSFGEEFLRRIAKRTGGLYIKFTDVSAFSNAFGYLSPAFRAMLTSGQVDAAKLGAKEVK